MLCRRFVLFAAAAVAVPHARAAEITDINKALAEVAKSGTPGMFVFHNGKKTKFEEGLETADVKAVSGKFVQAKISVVGKKELMTRFNINESKLPTILFVGPGGLELGSQECATPGRALDPKRFVPMMNNVLKDYPGKIKPLLAKRLKELPTMDVAQSGPFLTVLAENKYTEAGETIAKVLADPKSYPGTRVACVKTLAAFDEEKHWPAVAALLDTKEKDLAAAVKEALAGGKNASAALLGALKSENADVRANAYPIVRKAYGAEPGEKPVTFWKTGATDAREAQVKVIEEHIAKKSAAKDAKSKKD